MAADASSQKKGPTRVPLRSREPIWSLRKPLPASWQFWLGIVLPLLLLVLWVALTSGAKPVVGGAFLPKPTDVLRVLLRDLVIGKPDVVDGHKVVVRVLLDAALASSWRIVLSFLLAAGVALRGAMRMFFTYKGALFWKMQAGMGDVVFAPLYEVLKRRGVRFEFFHKLTNVGLGG